MIERYKICYNELEGDCMKVNIAVSARHVHLSRKDLDSLFGKGYELTVRIPLSQTGEFASEEKVTIQGPKGEIQGVRVLGPVRTMTQVEVSKTDAYHLGIQPPVRESGDLEGSSPIVIVGQKGTIHLSSGTIIANRHIHLNQIDAEHYGLKNGSKVKVQVFGEKGGILDNVYVKIKDSFVCELHLDLDDANAHFLKTGDEGEIIL